MSTTSTNTYGDRLTGTTFKHTLERDEEGDAKHTIDLHGNDLNGHPPSKVVVRSDDHRVFLWVGQGSRQTQTFAGTWPTVEEARAVAQSLHSVAAYVETDENEQQRAWREDEDGR